MNFTTSWDDGHPLDLKMCKLLKKHNIPGTFYISIKHNRECLKPSQIKKIAKDFKVGCHTYSHKDLTKLYPWHMEDEILIGKIELERIISETIDTFAYPFGRYDSKIINILKRLNFKEARTTKLFRTHVNNPFKMGITVYAKPHTKMFNIWAIIKSLDMKMFRFIQTNKLFDKPWDTIAIHLLKFVSKNNGVFHLFGHSWEIEENDDWDRLERVLEEMP